MKCNMILASFNGCWNLIVDAFEHDVDVRTCSGVFEQNIIFWVFENHSHGDSQGVALWVFEQHLPGVFRQKTMLQVLPVLEMYVCIHNGRYK